MKNKNEITNDDKNKIIELFYQGMHYGEICKIIDCSERAVRYAIKNRGIEARRKNRYTLNENFFNKIDSEEKAYFLGLLFADGFVGDAKHNNISLSASSINKDILEKFTTSIEFTGNIRRVKNKAGYHTENDIFTINFSSKTMCDDLRKYGMTGLKIDRLNTMINTKIPKNFVRHFYRGYIDGDGCIGIRDSSRNINGKTYSYQQPYIVLISTQYFLNNFIANVGITSGCFKKSKTDYMQYVYILKKKDVKTALDFLYKDAHVYLDRKFNSYKKCLKLLSK